LAYPGPQALPDCPMAFIAESKVKLGQLITDLMLYKYTVLGNWVDGIVKGLK
jgi:hypothetical protein